MTLEELILLAKGSQSYRDLAKRCDDRPSHQRLQQMATKGIQEFPDVEAINGMSKGFSVHPRVVINAAAESLGFEPTRGTALVDMLPARADELSAEEVSIVVQLVRHFIDAARWPWPAPSYDAARDQVIDRVAIQAAMNEPLDVTDPQAIETLLGQAIDAVLNDPDDSEPWPTEVARYLEPLGDKGRYVRELQRIREDALRFYSENEFDQVDLAKQREKAANGQTFSTPRVRPREVSIFDLPPQPNLLRPEPDYDEIERGGDLAARGGRKPKPEDTTGEESQVEDHDD